MKGRSIQWQENYFNCPHKQRRDSHDEKSNAKNLFYSVTFVYSAYWLVRQKASESAVSPEAEAVITAMFTAPNEELYSQDASNVIGENTDANSDDAFANSEKILENWNKLVGKYFETGRLEYFISTYGQTYLSEAAVNNTKIALKDISLDSKTDDSETVLVTFLVDKEEVVVKIYFSYDQDGLIKDVYPINFK